jgi:hypothetical protein
MFIYTLGDVIGIILIAPFLLVGVLVVISKAGDSVKRYFKGGVKGE